MKRVRLVNKKRKGLFLLMGLGEENTPEQTIKDKWQTTAQGYK
ncbi:hypothetical protein [Pedobacter sp. NJ-S-72]